VGTVHALTSPETAIIANATGAYLATLAGLESAGTRRVYSGVLQAFASGLGSGTAVASMTPRAVATWFTSHWASGQVERRAPLRIALLGGSSWITEDPIRLLRRRRKAPDRSRVLFRVDVDRLPTREDIPIRERTFWRLL
jgi:hypothetical protein